MGKRGRKPKGLDAAAESRIGELAAQGLGAPEIASRLGVSERTVSRRVAALRGPLKPRQGSPVPTPPAPPPSEPEGDDEALLGDDAPDRTLTDEELEQAALGGVSELDQLIKTIATDYKNAETGPLKQRIAGDYLKALDLRRKMTPPEPIDLNEQPDFVRLGKQVAERLHKMVDLVCEESRQG